ncbi:TIGR02302 family protein [Marinibacterium sp. SX1]|uniref:TIGR02302 family protein n=1 Tax=Marinibacterium sp. SX1 TaxID=3388424 RepID=UPI003D179F48
MPSTDRSALALRDLRRPLVLTRLGLVAERLWRAFWPVLSVLMVVLAALMLGLQDLLAVEIVWGAAVLSVLGLGAALVRGAMQFRWPSRAEALARLDETMPGRPIQALIDDQAIGNDDPASIAVWQAHQARMAARASKARAPQPDLRLAARDPFALRYVAALALAMGLIFGSILRVQSVSDMAPGGTAQAAAGPSWEGWIEPPRYTGLPTIYLADTEGDTLDIAEGARITLRFYGEVGALTLSETVSGRTEDLPSASAPSQDFIVTQPGRIAIDGPGGRAWQVALVDDADPQVDITGAPEAEAAGQMSLPFTASDDYGVIGGQATIALDLPAIERRHGLQIDPEPREPIVVTLPMPIAGDRRLFTESLIEDFSEHPFANLPVTFTLMVEDETGQTGETAAFSHVLPARRFFDPLAGAIIEQRRDLLWNRDNGPRIAQVLRAVSYRPEEIFRSDTAYLRLRVILRRLELFNEYGITDDQQAEIAQALWDLAIILEEGDLGDALERLRRAQERLSEAMKNGASDQEIAELMQELREATDDYMRQLSRQAQQDGQQGDQGQQMSENSMQMSQDDLQRMMDRIQELMEQGRMAEAEQALRELQQMMENMRVTQGQGQGQQSEGQQAMEGLAETLRDQQGLSDEAFRDLQEQFNPGANSGQSQQNQGSEGQGQGQGERHGQQGQGQGQQGQQPGQGQPDADALAERQRALRDELGRQQQNLPGAGTPEGDAVQRSLDRAGRAMDEAEDALREDDLAGAIDRQAEAMDALREGMRELGDQMAQQQQQGQPGQGNSEGDRQAQNRDPLGRDQGSNGSLATDDSLLQGEDVYRRAQELLDEIRRRSGEGERPDVELDYLRRLLERF